MILNLLNFDFKKLLSLFFSLIFLFLFLNILISKFNNHTEKSKITAIDFPNNYEGIYLSNEFYDNILNFNEFIISNNIKEALYTLGHSQQH